MIAHIDHVNISVQNVASSVNFYRELLGFEKTTDAHLEGDWIEAIVGLNGGGTDVSYVQPPGGGPPIELIECHAPGRHSDRHEPAAQYPGLPAPRLPCD